jgi:predicted N-acetyltransferase YhbS
LIVRKIAVNEFLVMESIYIRPYRPDDAIPPITALLHAAYAPLAKMGFRFLATHQDDATTLRRLQNGFAFVVEVDGAIVGTIALRPPATQSDCAWYLRPGVFTFGQFAVRPDLQRCGIGLRMLQFVEQQARELGATELALDTAEGALHLRHWYERLGFRFVQYVSWDDTNYRSVVLSKPLTGEV